MGLFTWAHVRRRASRTSICAHIRRQAEVAQEDFPSIPGNQDVLWFEVFVEDAFRVDEIDGVADLKYDSFDSSVIPCKRVASFCNVGPKITSWAVVKD